jgi:histidyl-tRNA synthetase
MAPPQQADRSVSPLQAVKGMNDILPPESARWEWFEHCVRTLMRRYGYRNLRTPVVEPTAMFVRGLGEVNCGRRPRPASCAR